MADDLLTLLQRATYELGCPGCGNSRHLEDECRTCHGEFRNEAAIELLRRLTNIAVRENRDGTAVTQ